MGAVERSLHNSELAQAVKRRSREFGAAKVEPLGSVRGTREPAGLALVEFDEPVMGRARCTPARGQIFPRMERFFRLSNDSFSEI